MNSGPAGPAEADESSSGEEDTELAAEEENPERTVQDDGSVPEKQIQRWKDEGGAWMPIP